MNNGAPAGGHHHHEERRVWTASFYQGEDSGHVVELSRRHVPQRNQVTISELCDEFRRQYARCDAIKIWSARNDMNEDECASLGRAFHNLDGLKKVTLVGAWNDEHADRLIRHISRRERITSLLIYGNKTQMDVTLQNLGTFSSIRIFALWFAHLQEDGCRILGRAVRSMPHITEFRMQFCQLSSCASYLAMIEEMRTNIPSFFIFSRTTLENYGFEDCPKAPELHKTFYALMRQKQDSNQALREVVEAHVEYIKHHNEAQELKTLKPEPWVEALTARHVRTREDLLFLWLTKNPDLYAREALKALEKTRNDDESR